MPDANVLFINEFPGTGYPGFTTEWPDFTFPSGNPPFSKPVVDGYGHGIGSRSFGGPTTTKAWRGYTDYMPGRQNYKCDLYVKFDNPESGTASVALLLRFIDYDNCIVARLKVGGAGGIPTLKLYSRIAGTETQIGATYSGYSNSELAAGITFRVRVEDLAAGTTRVTAYKNVSVSSNGSVTIDTTESTLGIFANAYPPGVELMNVFNTDARIYSLTCYDFADEWTVGTPDAVGTGWQVEIGDTLYSMADLRALLPPVKLIVPKHAYGATGNDVTLQVYGDFRLGSVVYPGRPVRVLHNNDVRFNGYVAEADQSATAKSEIQNFRCRDAQWRSRQVQLQTDDKTGTFYFNVYAPGAVSGGACAGPGADVPDEYDPDLQDMTIGAVIKYLFDNNSDGTEKLRFYGAAPGSGAAYVQAELDLMDAVIPDLRVSGSFINAIQQLLKYMPKFQCFVDPATKIWHFVDVTDLSAETVALPTDVVPSIKIKPDPDKSYNAVVWRGGKPQDKDPVTLSIAEGTVGNAWTEDQAANNSDANQHKAFFPLTVASSGTASNVTLNGKFYISLNYVVISGADSVKYDIKNDDWRGAIISSLLGFDRFVISNTSTRFYLSAPNWGAPPAPGTTATVTYLDPCALEVLSASGVGRGFVLFRPGNICGIGDSTGILSYKAGLKNKGRCGNATVLGKGLDGISYAQQYEYETRALTEEAQVAFGICDPLLFLSKPVLLPLGLVNYFGDKGSAPKTPCTPGYNPMTGIDLKVNLSEYEPETAYQRWPTIGYRGDSFSTDQANWDGGGEPNAEGDWKCRNVLLIDDPEFRDVGIQGPGILKAQQAIIDLFGQKAYTVEVQIVTPWVAPDSATPAAQTTRFANLQKCLRISSTKRTTGLETVTNLPIYEVSWDIDKNITTVKAGTPVAWANIDPKSLASAYVDKNILKKVYQKMKEVEDYRNQMLGHSASRAGAGTPSMSACQVSFSDNDTKRSTTVQKELPRKDQKIASLKAESGLDRLLTTGKQVDIPGTPVSVPGLSGAAAQMPVRSAAVLESLARHDLFDMGPVSGTKVNGDRSRYGGMIGMDSDEAGTPSEIIFRMGGYAFRPKPDKTGSTLAGVGFQFAQLTAAGVPGAYVDFTGPESFAQEHTPLNFITPGTLLDTLLGRVRDLETNLGRVIDAQTEKAIAPGDKDKAATVYPDGAPADLLTVAMAMSKFEGSQLLTHTIKDPGGAVFTGSRSTAGVDSQSYWRVMMPERVVAQVENVGWGAGHNGGAWGFVTVGNAQVFVNSMRIEHKQAHGPNLDSDGSCVACALAAADDSPYGFQNAGGKNLDPTLESGVGTIFPLPAGSHGIPVFQVMTKEVASEGAGAGLVHRAKFSYSYKASPWTVAASTATGTALTTDGSGGGTGVYKAPAGAVPAGLRIPSDAPSGVAVSVQRTPGAGSDTASGKTTTVIGIGVDVAVADGGIWIRVRDQGIEIDDALVHNHPQAIEGCDQTEVWSFEFGKVVLAPVDVGDYLAAELNPPIALNDNVGVGDLVVVTL